MPDQDVKPWYRQFWPWFLICLPGSAVVASLYTASLAVRTTDSLVTDAAGGMDVVTERHLAAERNARELGLAASIRIDAKSGAIVATLSSDTAREWPKTLDLMFSHPTLAAHDQSIVLSSAIPDDAGNPSWSGHVIDVPAGRRYVVLRSGDAWRLTGSWTGSDTVELTPASRRDEPATMND